MSLVLAPKGVHVWGKPASPAAEVFIERPRKPSYWAKSEMAGFYRLADSIRGRRPAESPYAHTRPNTRVMIMPSYAGVSVGPQGSAVADDKGVSAPPAPESYNSNSLDRHARQARIARNRQSDPYASTRPPSTSTAKEMLAAANADDSAPAGPAAQPAETAAAGPTPLEEIIGTANALADAVADVNLKDALDEVKQAALGLRTIAAKRPLSEEEKGQWADLDAALQRIAEDAARPMRRHSSA